MFSVAANLTFDILSQNSIGFVFLSKRVPFYLTDVEYLKLIVKSKCKNNLVNKCNFSPLTYCLQDWYCELESRSGQMYSIQHYHYVIKFVSNLWQAGGFHRVLRFPSPIKLTANDITEILLKVALNTITHHQSKTDRVLPLSNIE